MKSKRRGFGEGTGSLSEMVQTTLEDVNGGLLDVAVIGAGFGGLYMLHKLLQGGHSVRAFEASAGVGGTWNFNRYPGARCDVESFQYSYSFDEELQQEWEWTERFATQPEILRYANHVADRFNLRQHITFNTRIVSATFNEDRNLWDLVTDAGKRFQARFVVGAVGGLSARHLPDLPGLSSFKGKILHTGSWPHEPIDFSGLRVAVVGTGSSGIQVIPELAKQAAHLTVFQRTPNFSLPARNVRLTEKEVREWKANYPEHSRYMREDTRAGCIYELPKMGALEATESERQHEFERRWQLGGTDFGASFNDLSTNEDSNKTAADFVRSKIRQIVDDPEIAETLCPYEYPIFTKRICLDTDYYATFNRENVELVDLRKNAIEAFTEKGIKAKDRQRDFDVIVFATGFDAITGALLAIDIRGVGALTLREKWSAGPRVYLGLVSAHFPNLFMLTGPGSPAPLANVLVSIEQHVEFVANCIEYMNRNRIARIDAETEAEDAWVNHVNEVANTTLYPKAGSWYLGANIPGKPRVFMPYFGVNTYRQKCEAVVREGYRGFVLKTEEQLKSSKGSDQDNDTDHKLVASGTSKYAQT